MTERLARGARPAAVLLFGVAGAYPARHRGGAPALGLLDLALVGSDCLADDGAAAPDGFRDLAALGLGDCGPFAADAALAAAAARALGGIAVAAGATVSACSATEALSEERARRTGAALETMEGAAVALACARFGVPLVQLRCISNFTGDRDRAEWRLRAACEQLHAAVLAAHAAIELFPPVAVSPGDGS